MSPAGPTSRRRLEDAKQTSCFASWSEHDAVSSMGFGVPVIKVFDSLFVPLAKWSCC